MSYEELTPMARGRYDGYMDQGSTEQQKQGEETREDVLPGPASEAAKLLFRNAKNGVHENEEPEQAKKGPQEDLLRGKERETKPKRKFTRDRLVEVAQTVQGKASMEDVVTDALFVSAAARVLIGNIKEDEKNRQANEGLLKEIDANKILQQADQIMRVIDDNRRPDGETVKEQDSPGRRSAVLGTAGSVAKLAEAIANYYEKAQISKEVDDPFKQITSFEELMTKFSKSQDKDIFRAGGEFSLIDVTSHTDEFGRELTEETAHPESFLRWIRERVQFYHDFDPMSPVELFKSMYVVAGSRTVSIYEILVDFDVYFAHRVPTKGDLMVTQDDLKRAQDAGNLEGIKRNAVGQIEEAYYKNFIDPETKQPTRAHVELTNEGNKRGVQVSKVTYVNKDGEKVSVQAVLESKEDWNTVKDEGYETIKEWGLYEVWLMMKNHNMDVQYRQKGMQSEKPLSETLAELYSENIWTRTPDRLLRMFNMPSTTQRQDRDEEGKRDLSSEATDAMKGKSGEQGSLGKAFQRSLAAYYHISEANAAYKGYQLEDKRNPFSELLQKEGFNGAEVFYKSILRRTLEESLGYDAYHAKKNPHPERAAADLIWRLNETRINREDGTSRARKAWEKAELVDLVVLDKKRFLQEAEKRGITAEQFDQAVADMRREYGELDEKGQPNKLYNKAKLEELDRLFSEKTSAKKAKLAEQIRTKLGSNKDYSKAQTAFLERDANHSDDDPINGNPFEGLDAYAVAAFVQSYNSEYTPGVNPFEHIRYSLQARDRMRKAMRDVLVQTEHLDDFEALYAEEWAYTFTYHTGISARNDMMGIGHDAWSKVLNTEYYRLRQTSGGNYPGNLDNLYGIHRLGVDFWQGLKVREADSNDYDRTLYHELVGLEQDKNGKYVFNINKKMANYEFPGNAMRQYYGDHVSHAVDLFIDITQKQEFNLDKLVQHDNFGRLVWSNEEMQKMIDSTWKHMRYGFDNNAFLYDKVHYGWLYDETINKEGGVSRTPRFGFMSLRELMFSQKVREELNMYKRTDLSGWGEKEYKGKMARNVFAYLIAAQLREHTRYKGGYRIYSAHEVQMVTEAFMNYAARVMQGKDGETIVMSGFFTPEEIMKILVVAHAVLWQLYLKEYGISAGGGLLFGLFEAFAMIMKQLGSGIKL